MSEATEPHKKQLKVAFAKLGKLDKYAAEKMVEALDSYIDARIADATGQEVRPALKLFPSDLL
jgi:hypothetical protein